MKTTLKSKTIIFFLSAGILFSGCSRKNANIPPDMSVPDTTFSDNADTKAPSASDTNTVPSDTSVADAVSGEVSGQNFSAHSDVPELLSFVDAHGNSYETTINPDVRKHDYDLSCFSHNGNRLSYEGDSRYAYRLGIDVSYHEGKIDWEKVAADGFEFAIIRLGARGYGKEGKIFLDEKFHTNMEQAKNAGLDVGVYFFSQAVNEAEAKEEAEFVLQNLEGYELDLPVVYDPESILDDTARTDHVSGEQFTKNTVLFCEMIKAAGYEAMVYSNMLWEAEKFDLTQLADYPIWYADYEALPQTPYRFSFWQYTDTALIDAVTEGLDNNYVDLDIQLYEIVAPSTDKISPVT